MASVAFAEALGFERFLPSADAPQPPAARARDALLWAYARLNDEKTDRKHLFVLSDGAPVDDSTLSVNPGNFLQKHLGDVVDWLAQQPVTVTAIGIGHDISQYFPGSGKGAIDAERLALSVFQGLRPYFGNTSKRT